MKTIEIYLQDLTPEKQAEILKSHGNNGNYDVSPITTIEYEEDLKMKKFSVVIHFGGTMNYEIEAKTEEEAVDTAEQMFNEEDEEDIAASVTDYDIFECSEL